MNRYDFIDFRYTNALNNDRIITTRFNDQTRIYTEACNNSNNNNDTKCSNDNK